MAQRRMFDRSITTSDKFLDMSKTAQLLYFHLGMEADDEGFIGNVKMLLRAYGANDDDVRLLITKNFVIEFESGVFVITHWNENNSIRADRKKLTKFTDEKARLVLNSDGQYVQRTQLNQGAQPIDDQLTTKRQPADNQMSAQVRLGKDSKYIDQTSLTDRFETLWKMYPRKSGKKQSFEIYKRAIKKGVTDDEIEQGIENYLQQIKVKGTPTQYIKQGVTWFRNEGWNDEYDFTPERPVNGKQPRVIEHRPAEWTAVPNDDDIIPDFEI